MNFPNELRNFLLLCEAIGLTAVYTGLALGLLVISLWTLLTHKAVKRGR